MPPGCAILAMVSDSRTRHRYRMLEIQELGPYALRRCDEGGAARDVSGQASMSVTAGDMFRLSPIVA
jgi:hypothetical protein